MRTPAIAALCLLLVTSALAYAAPTILRGTVSGPGGPITGARVEAVKERAALGGTETGPDGRFTLILPDRPLGLIVSAAGCITRELTVGDRGEELAVDMRAGGRTLFGRVVDLEGVPVRGAVLEVLSVVPRDRGIWTGRPRTPEASIYLRAEHGVTALRAVAERDGSFAISGLLDNAKLTWRASARGRVSAEQGADWPPRYPLEVVLAPEAVIEGTGPAGGQPVAGVVVEVSGTPAGKQISDAEGRFTLRQLPPGPIWLRVTPPPGLLAPSLQPVLEAGEQRTIEVALVTPATVRGRVTRQDSGEPVANAAVAAGVDGAELSSGRTDADGRYEILLPPGRISVRYVGTGPVRPFPGPLDRSAPRVEVTAPAGVVTEAPDLQIEAWMAEGMVIRGVVLGIDGQPYHGATVSLLGYPTMPGQEESPTATSDAGGRFELRAGAPRSVPLMGVMARSLEDDVAVAVFARGETTPLALRLRPAAWVSAALVDPRGRPLTMERVEIEAMLVSDERMFLPLRPETRCAPGRVAAGPLPPGCTVRISIGPNTSELRTSNRGWGHSRLELTPGARIELPDLVLNPAGRRLSGRVLDPLERPVAGAVVATYGFIGVREPVHTGDDGQFVLAPLRSWGTVTVLAAASDGSLCCARTLDPDQPLPATLVLTEPAAVEGALLDHQDRPRPGVQVRVSGRWGSLPVMPELGLMGSGSATTDAAGRWRVEGLVPGARYVIEAWEHSSNTRASATIELLEPGMNPPVELRLQPAAEPEQSPQPAAAG